MGEKERKTQNSRKREFMNINGNTNQSLLLERVANLPREIFQVQSDLNRKMLNLAVEVGIRNSKEEGQKRILDLYA